MDAAEFSAQYVLRAAAITLLAGSLAGLIAHRLRLPDIVLFILAGVLLGPQVSGWLSVPAQSTLSQLALLFGASYILFDGGATLRLAVLREIWLTLVVIATLGVLVTAAVVAGAAHYILALPILTALLLGAILAPTDPATLIPVFKQVRIRARLAQLAISESAVNDAVGAMLTLTVLGVLLGGEFHAGTALTGMLRDAGLGVLIGLLLGLAATFVIHSDSFGFREEYLPIVTLLVVVGAYLSAEHMQASGFIAVFVAGFIVANPPALLLRDGTRNLAHLDEFIASTSLIMRMFIFILLGAQVSFALLARHALPALALALVLMFVARPAAVFLCAAPDRRARWSLQELLFMCWTRETGVIPAALGGIVVSKGIAGAELIQAVIFTVALTTIALQASSTRWLAGRLGLLEEVAPSPPAASLGPPR
jgi:cell volume regulation protein A